MEKVDKEKFIRDIKKDLGIEERKQFENYTDKKLDNFKDLGDIFEEFVLNRKEENILNNPNNIFVTCKIKNEEAKKGCDKYIKIKRKKEDNTVEKTNIKIRIPQNIKNNQKIILRREGNMGENNRGHLVVEIRVK